MSHCVRSKPNRCHRDSCRLNHRRYSSEPPPLPALSDRYNTINCFTVAAEQACLNASQNTQLFWNRTCYPISEFCSEHGYSLVNATHCVREGVMDAAPTPFAEIGHRISASEDYFT